MTDRPAVRFYDDPVSCYARPRPRKVRLALRELLGWVTFALVLLAAVTVDGLDDAQLIALSVALVCVGGAWALLRWDER